MSFVFQPVGSIGSGKELYTKEENYTNEYQTLHVIIPVLCLPLLPKRVSPKYVVLDGGALNLPGLFSFQRWEVQGMAKSSVRSPPWEKGRQFSTLGVVGSGKFFDAKGHERVSAELKEKGNKNHKCFLGGNCWKGSSHRNGITKRPVTG